MLALLAPGSVAFASGSAHLQYSRELYEQALASREPFLLDFYASWRGTCRVQERTVRALVDGNPAYRAVRIIRVDWDVHRRGPIVKELRIPRRSTLVMFDEGKEVARVVARTRREDIEALFAA